ncbi:MAG: site-specific integrase, partial [Verrucomicrobiota bacterium]
YWDWIRRYIVFHGKKHPRDLAETEVRDFLVHLATERRVSASTQNQALNALVFLYRHVLASQSVFWETSSGRVATRSRLRF